MKKDWVLSNPLSTQRRLWSDWADAQADLSLRWAHMPFCCFVMKRLEYVTRHKQLIHNAITGYSTTDPYRWRTVHWKWICIEYGRNLRNKVVLLSKLILVFKKTKNNTTNRTHCKFISVLLCSMSNTDLKFSLLTNVQILYAVKMTGYEISTEVMPTTFYETVITIRTIPHIRCIPTRCFHYFQKSRIQSYNFLC